MVSEYFVRKVFKMLLLVLSLCLLAAPVYGLTEAQEGARHAVRIKFYMMKNNDWNNGGGLVVATSLAKEVTEYCSENYGYCGLKYWDDNFAFTAGHVIPIEFDADMVYPFEESSGVIVKLYMRFNGGVLAANATNITDYVLHQQAFEDAVIEHYEEISDAVGHSVIGVGAASLSPKPDYITNIVMCILALILLLVVLLVALGCWIYAKRQERAAKRYSSPNKITPTPEIRRSHKVKKRELAREPTVFTVEEPQYHKRKQKKKKKSKRHEETFRVQSGGHDSFDVSQSVMSQSMTSQPMASTPQPTYPVVEEEPDTNITVVPMPDGAASFAYKAQTDDEDEEYDSAFQESNNGHHQHQQHQHQHQHQVEHQNDHHYHHHQQQHNGNRKITDL